MSQLYPCFIPIVLAELLLTLKSILVWTIYSMVIAILRDFSSGSGSESTLPPGAQLLSPRHPSDYPCSFVMFYCIVSGYTGKSFGSCII